MKKIKIDKNIKVIFVILIVYLIIMLAIFLPGYLRKKYEKFYIITSTYKLKYEYGSWKRIESNKDYANRKFETYVNDTYKGKYELALRKNKIVLIDDEKIVNYSGDVCAYSGNIKFNYENEIKNSKTTENDKQYAIEALKQSKIDENAYFNIETKIEMDVNNDGKLETIYVIDNVDNTEKEGIEYIDYVRGYISNNSGVNFSIMYMQTNGKVKIIDKYVDKTDFQNIMIDKIIDIRKDGKKEIIYKLGYETVMEPNCVKMANLSKNKIIYNSCE